MARRRCRIERAPSRRSRGPVFKRSKLRCSGHREMSRLRALLRCRETAIMRWIVRTFGISRSMSEIWETKYGLRRVRHDPPTLDEAIAAAQGLSDELDEQVEIAAGLMALPVDVVRAEILKAAKPAKSAGACRHDAEPGRRDAHRHCRAQASRRVRTTASDFIARSKSLCSGESDAHAGTNSIGMPAARSAARSMPDAIRRVR